MILPPPVRITGVGVAGAFGDTDGLRQILRDRRIPDLSVPVSFDTISGPVHTRGLLADTSKLKEMIPPRRLRRVDEFTRLTLTAALPALADGGYENPPEGLGIITATGYGPTCNTFDFQEFAGDEGLRRFSPIQFSNSVHNAAAAHLAAALNMSGPNLAVNQFSLSVPAALMTAAVWLGQGRAKAVLVGGADIFCRALAVFREEFIRLYPDHPSPAPVGEGAAYFLLEPDDPNIDDRRNPRVTAITGAIRNFSSELLTDASCVLDLPPLMAGPEMKSGGSSTYPAVSSFLSSLSSSSRAAPVATCAGLTGLFPSANALLTAIAALSLREGCGMPVDSPSDFGGISVSNVSSRPCMDFSPATNCLTLTESGYGGLIRVSV